MADFNTTTQGIDATAVAIAGNDAVNVSNSDKKNWYAAMAKAWGEALDSQAQVITDLSDQIANQGQDNPGTITMLTAQSQRMGFLASNASTSTSSVGKALETLARKG